MPMNYVLIKPLGLVIPFDYINSFALTSESRKVFEIAERKLHTDDIYITTKTTLTCGVTIVLPRSILDKANTADVINENIEETMVELMNRAATVVEKKPRRGRKSKELAEASEEDNSDVDIENLITEKAVFLPAAKYYVEMESVPIAQSQVLSVLNEKNLERVEDHIGKFNSIRKKIEELRTQLRAPTTENIESSFGAMDESSRIDSEGFANYENNLRNRLQQLENALVTQTEWLRNTFIPHVNSKVEVKQGVLRSNKFTFGETVIKREDIIEAINQEVFDTTSFSF